MVGSHDIYRDPFRTDYGCRSDRVAMEPGRGLGLRVEGREALTGRMEQDSN